MLKIGHVDDCDKLTFFFGEKNVNPFDELLAFLNMEGVAEGNAKKVEQQRAREKRKIARDEEKNDHAPAARKKRKQKRRKKSKNNEK